MRISIILFVLACFIRVGFAHDYWIAPVTYQPQVGQGVPVRLFVGDHFHGEIERPLQEKMTVTFQLHDSVDHASDLLEGAVFEKTPITNLRLPKPGSYLLSMQRDWSFIEMKGDKFHQYLEHEGLGHIIKQRTDAGDAGKSATERYRRYLKSLVVADGKPTDTWKKSLGHKLEIMPLSDPSTTDVGKRLVVQVFFDGKPLVDVQVGAMGRKEGEVTDRHARTDKSGKVSFKIDHPGEWIVRLVHLRQSTDPEEADWESFWSAMTFGVQ
ncbi:MAG: DUF4198 domain-containing protein [Planctomycetes bacterium]|nr:DUF4198 domain-containing protein [Planctomycetota bacterium]